MEIKSICEDIIQIVVPFVPEEKRALQRKFVIKLT